MEPNRIRMVIIFLSISVLFGFSNLHSQVKPEDNYLGGIKEELLKDWPKNKTINLVFHGHSVPAGYFKTPVVNTLEAYPYLVLKQLKAHYPKAVLNVINTSVGGENSESGAARFEKEVLNHRPHVLFIDYSLNDRRIGLEKSADSWKSMISKALELNIKVILLTPSPDQRVNLLETDNVLELHSNQVVGLAKEFKVGLVNSYELFREKVASGEDVAKYMSQVNHPNRPGHQLIADAIVKYFID